MRRREPAAPERGTGGADGNNPMTHVVVSSLPRPVPLTLDEQWLALFDVKERHADKR
jgi:hypothetical protein